MSQRSCNINIFLKDTDQQAEVINKIIFDLGLEGKGKIRKTYEGLSYQYRNIRIESCKPIFGRGYKGHFTICNKDEIDTEDEYELITSHSAILGSLVPFKNIFVNEFFDPEPEYYTAREKDHLLDVKDDFSYMYDIIKRLKLNEEPPKEEKKRGKK